MKTRSTFFLSACITLCLLGVISTTAAQNRGVLPQRFSAGVFLGLNASQMDGDKHNGYNKFGLMGGLQGGILLTRQSKFGMDLFYSRRGSRSDRTATGSPLKGSNALPVDISLDYVQIGLTYYYMFAENYDDFYRWSANFGLSYGRLLNSVVDEVKLVGGSDFEIAELEGLFSQNAIDLGLGVTYNFNEQFGLSARHSFELIPLYKNQGNTEELINRLLQYYISVNLIYTFY